MLHTKSVSIFLFIYKMVIAVPPEACFAKFRWDDCGKPPRPVLYYWKPGSRCEVGMWRGCLPNMNMFKDEYECVSTCIFTARAQPPDYHAIIENEEEEETKTEATEDVITSSSVDDNQTTIEATTIDINSTVSEATNTTQAGTETTTIEANGTAVETGNNTVTADVNSTITNSTSK